MKRLLTQKCLDWMRQPHRKPLLIDGARQVGKTHLITKLFGSEYFKRVHHIDLKAQLKAHDIFSDDLDSKTILKKCELYLNTSIDADKDLIFFDEIGECQRAVDSLKYFKEERPDLFISASGSNIGLLDSFPVGQVYMLELFPMSYEEFLMALDEESKMLSIFLERKRTRLTHDLLWQVLLDYYFVGGMPEAVKSWAETKSESTIKRIAQINQIHKDLIVGYKRDFGKYAGKADALQIDQVFSALPIQLSKFTDDSVKRCRFSEIIPKKSRYQQLKTPIDWLEKTKLVAKCYPIDCEPKVPLQSRIKNNIFKLFYFDVGLLGHVLEISYAEQIQQKIDFKGFIAENFVQNELRSFGYYPTYSWNEGESEVEFLIKTSKGEIYPLEVKSGKRTQAKSLRVYKQKYHPKKTIKLVGAQGGSDEHDIVWPLYDAKFVLDI